MSMAIVSSNALTSLTGWIELCSFGVKWEGAPFSTSGTRNPEPGSGLLVKGGPSTHNRVMVFVDFG